MFVFSNFLAFFSNNVVEIIGIISGISVTFICYVFPVMCYVKSNQHPRYHYKNLVSLAIMVLISCLGLMSTFKSGIENYLKWMDAQEIVKAANGTVNFIVGS